MKAHLKIFGWISGELKDVQAQRDGSVHCVLDDGKRRIAVQLTRDEVRRLAAQLMSDLSGARAP